MTDLAILFTLLLSALLSATLSPGSSEATLIGLLAAGHGPMLLLVSAATVGNVLGSVVNWVLGRFFAHFRDRRWFPVSAAAYERATGWYRRYGLWSLLFSWVPVIGDPLTLAAGALRADLRWFVLLVSAGKFARYGILASGFHWWSH